MSEEIYNDDSYYNNILNRLHIKYSVYEGLLMVKKHYLTNNKNYYIFCIFFRFLYILLLSGDYDSILFSNNNSKSIQSYLRVLTIHNILQKFSISFTIYCLIVWIICIFTIIMITINFNYLKKISNYKHTYLWPFPTKFQIILDHINFLLFPYIIEYLSFSYYIFFYPNTYIINLNSANDKFLLIFIMIVNTILIIIYNIDNYISIHCSNKIFTSTIFDANLREKDRKIASNTISYRCSKFRLYLITFIQNFIIFVNFENYIKSKFYKIIFIIIISIILLISILLFFLDKINTFNYLNNINTFINVLFLYCILSIVIDFIIFIIGYKINNLLVEFLYIFIKIIIGLVAYSLFIYKSHSFLKSKISEILFLEKNNKIDKYFSNCLYYLHEIMLMIKEQNKIEPAYELIKSCNKHINDCKNINCNCKFLKICNEKLINNNDTSINNYISEYINILNYLFECPFIDIYIYNYYDLSIILAEHFCHLKDNPTVAFSIICTLIIRKRNKFSTFEIAILFEICQKYIYFITAREDKNIEDEIRVNKNELLQNRIREEYIKSYYHNLMLSNKIKKLMNNYIEIIIKILKYKSIFEDSITFQYDENNENKNSVKINFFESNSKIEDFNSNNKNKEDKKLKELKNESNLYIIIYLLNKEQLYYNEILDSVKKIQFSKKLKIFIIFKYFFFFDIFSGGKIPDKIEEKLYSFLDEKINLFNTKITKDEYSILKRRYDEQNRITSKFYLIVEFNKELITKYFYEEIIIKLGYTQKEIINKSIDILLPKEFVSSHLNTIKQTMIYDQKRYSALKQSYCFNKELNVLYYANFEGAILYNISKYLMIMMESNVIQEIEYRFMLNNNFELIANSKNFVDEYYINQKIFRLYNFNFLDIIGMKPEKIKKVFKNEFKKINYQKIGRQVKTQEYILHEFYVPEKNGGEMRSANFKNIKNQILSKILSRNEEEEENINENENEDEENKSLIQNKNILSTISDLFIAPREVYFYQTYDKVINKADFIENLANELNKIPDNDLIMENDKYNHNLILTAKELISYLKLKKKELSKHYIDISIKFSFYYDKVYYFISIRDEKKINLEIYKNINFHKNYTKRLSTNNGDIIPYDKKNKKKSRNIKNIINHIPKERKSNVKKASKNLSHLDDNNDINKKEVEKLKTLNKIEEYKILINKAQFIKIIKFALSSIIFCIIMIYSITTILQNSSIQKIQIILIAYYYSLFSKNLLLGVHSIILNIFYDLFILKKQDYSINYRILYKLTCDLKDKYHNYSMLFHDYNLAIGHKVDLLYKKRNFTKLMGYWKEIEYESEYTYELDFIIYSILSYNSSELLTNENNIDFKNILFFKDRSETPQIINCAYVKLLYYLNINYEFVYKDMFKEIEDSIYNSYLLFLKQKDAIILVFEIIGLLSYILFFITVILYLYYSNNIIIKNIIFLFFDFDIENKGNNNNKINLKLIELRKILDDFNISLFDNYSKKIDKLNKSITSIDVDNTNIINTNNDNLLNENIPKSRRDLKNLENNNMESTFLSDLKNKSINNSSSQLYLVESNPKSFKESLNNNQINSNNNITYKANLSKKENEEQINNQDIILNKSNKPLVLMIKIYFIIIIILFFMLLAFIVLKFILMDSLENKFSRFFVDLIVITDRYMQVYYYFNILRILLILPNDERKKKFENILENMNEFYNKENNKFNEILSKSINNYPETYRIINIIKYSDSNLSDIIKDNICQEEKICNLYIDSSPNIFNSGIEFGFRSNIIQINNFYIDYKKLIDNTNINEIKQSLNINQFSQFEEIMSSLNYLYVFVEQRIFLSYEKDGIKFIAYYLKINTALNMISIFFSIVIFLFVIIFIFFSISEFTNPIKDSTYRINCSFYFIANYSLKN